jgi:hypothetical protein
MMVQQIRVENLTEPILTHLPVIQDKGITDQSGFSRLKCPTKGHRTDFNVTCSGYANGQNATVNLSCDGVLPYLYYRCPVLPGCLYWDKKASGFRNHGCKTVTKRVDDVTRSITCATTHLTTFAATGYSATESIATLSAAVYDLRKPETLRRSLGLVLTGWGGLLPTFHRTTLCSSKRESQLGEPRFVTATVTIMYASLALGLLLLRWRRVKERYAYLRQACAVLKLVHVIGQCKRAQRNLHVAKCVEPVQPRAADAHV